MKTYIQISLEKTDNLEKFVEILEGIKHLDVLSEVQFSGVLLL